MSNSLDGYTSSFNPLQEAQAWFDLLSLKYPLLAEALLGNEHTRNGGPLRPPLSLIVSNKDGKLRAILSGPESSKSYFAPIEDASDVLASVEKALRDNTGEWSMKRPPGARR